MKASVRDQLLEVFGKIDRPGTFHASGRLPSIYPGLNVAGVGTIALPLEARQAADLKKLARQAPYGKGTRTLVDTNVRRVWEIDADQVTLANPEWADVVKQAVETAQAGLGLERRKLEAHLYKLLLYEKGSFFLAHRDGEKLERMVATLVIALPSQHEGGELVIRHEGREEIVDFGPQSAFETRFAAFYADCEHEVRPVTSGYRLSLVYNLTLKASNRSIAAPTSRGHVAETARLLGQWARHSQAAIEANDDSFPTKLAVVLDHKYSQAGLARDALKGTDRARADVMFEAAREADCDASLALVTYWESGSAEDSGGYGYGYGYGGRRYRDFDEEEDGGPYVMEEVFDQAQTAAHFRDADGNPLAYGRLPVDNEEIVSKEPLNTGKPDKEDFEGYTGNAGMTLERWYHRAAVIVWPAQARFDVLCEAGTQAAVGGLEAMLRRWKRAKPDEREALKSSCLEFADRILDHWPERDFESGHYDDGMDYGSGGIGGLDDDNDNNDEEWDGQELDEEAADGPDAELVEDDDERPGLVRSEGLQAGSGAGKSAGAAGPSSLLALLGELGDTKLIAAWARKVASKDMTADPGKALGDLCARHGWLTFQNELEALFDGTSNESLARQTRLLDDFALRKDQSADRKALAVSLARRLVSALERWDPQLAKRDWRAKVVDLVEVLSLLTRTLLALEEPKLLDRVVVHVLDRPKRFDWTTVQVPVLLGLKPWLKQNLDRAVPPLRRWIAGAIAELERRAAAPPQGPADWRRGSNTGCQCADCKTLSQFLSDPNTETLRLPLAKQRRQHLHIIIDNKQLDTTHVTERKGRPFTLVCTKTKASYERAMKAHRLDLEQLAGLHKLLDWYNGLSALSERSPKTATKPKPKSGPKSNAKSLAPVRERAKTKTRKRN